MGKRTRFQFFSKLLILILAAGMIFGPYSFNFSNLSFVKQEAHAAIFTDTFNTAGTFTWTAPDGVATATVETWGAGGGGGTTNANTGAGGGGGGVYAKAVIGVTPGTDYMVIVGAGGAVDQAVTAGSSSFNGAAVFALGGTGTAGGTGGAGGSDTNSSGTTKNVGGTGGTGNTLDGSGGGGGAAGPDGVGVTAANATSALGTYGGNGDNGSGGAGGASGAPASGVISNALGGGGGGGANDNSTGGTGGAPGGGGGGGGAGGNTGAAGQVKVTYAARTVLGNGTSTNPGNATIAPGAAATSSDAFTFKTSTSTDTVTAVTVGLAANTTSGINKVEITSEDGSIVYGSSTDPTADSFSITLNQSTLTATTATTTYKIRITPKSHLSMPAPPGVEYAVTSTITSFSSANASSGTDGTSGTITIDNASPGGVTATSTTPGQGQIDLGWTNPGGDFESVVAVRATSTAVTGGPTEGASYSAGNALGNGFVAYAGSGTSVSDTGLADGTTYYYQIWSKDTRGNYTASSTTANATTNAGATPAIRAAANQTFTVGDGLTAISAITVTSTAASQITAANDIRISIATGTTNFLWDTNDLTATISGDGDVSPTVSYENSSSTLVLNVLTNFANASSVTVSGLSFRDFNGVNAATTTFDLRWQGASQSPPFARATSTTVTIKGRFDVGQHSAGQEANKFSTASTTSNAELFAFQLLPNDENASTTLVVQLSSITGIVTSDISGPWLYIDANANGTVDGGETSTAFGLGAVNIPGGTGTITFTSSTAVAVATSTRYILKATSSNLLAGDTITFGLGASDITSDGLTSLARLSPTAASPPSNIAHTVGGASRNERSFRWQNDDGANVNSNTAIQAADVNVTSTQIGERLTLRLQVDNDGGGEASGIQYKLQFQANGTSSTWTDVSASAAIQPSLGLAGIDADAITSAVAAANARTFTNGTWHENTGLSNGSTVIGNSGYTELAYVIETSNAASSTTYYFRLYNNTASAELNGYTVYPALTTVASSSFLTQYSKQAGTLPNTTSSLTYYLDNREYTNVGADDGNYATSTAAANIPIFNFRVRNTTSSHPLKVTWNGNYSAASTTFLEIFRMGGTNAWQTLVSTSTPSVNTDFTLVGYVATSTSEYYQAESDGRFSTWVRVRQATTTGSLRTDYLNVDYLPFAESAADQTFEVNQSPAGISQLRIKAASSTPVVTAANDIRIVIPAALGMKWATSTTVATLGGSASGKASTTVQYPDDNTLLINVETNFAGNDDLTISGLSFKNFTAGAASTSLNLYYNGTSTGMAEAIDLKKKIIRGQYALANHSAGQEDNKLSGGGSVTAAELLAFELTPTGENASTTQLVVDLYEVAGFAGANITNAELRVDANNDGTISGGETQTVGGGGSVALSGGTGTITFSTAFSLTATMSIILRADVAAIDDSDVLKLKLQPSQITATGITSVVALAPAGSTPFATHFKPPHQGGGGGPSEAPPPWAANVGGGGSGGGAGGSEGGGGAPPPSQGGGGSGGGSGGSP